MYKIERNKTDYDSFSMGVEFLYNKINKINTTFGLHYKSLESLLTGKTLLECISYFDKISTTSMLSHEHAFVLGVEKSMQQNVAKKNQYIRVALAELTRINAHLKCIEDLLKEIKLQSLSVFLLAKREELKSIFLEITGSFYMPNYFRFGGIARDLFIGQEEQIAEFLEQLAPIMKKVDSMLRKSASFQSATKGVGVISKSDALSFGFSGPSLRATGVDFDLRKNNPYEIYEDITFDVVVEERGDVFARYNVLFAEIFESIKIIMECLSNLTHGEEIEKSKIELPTKLSSKGDIFNLSRYTLLYTKGFVPPKGYFYSAVEAPNGEFGVFLGFDGVSNKPMAVKINAPSIHHLQGITEIMKNKNIDDIFTILSSFAVNIREVEL